MSLWRRVWNSIRPATLNRDLDDELEFHREMRLRRGREQGLSPADAAREAQHRLGNVTLAAEEMRDARLVEWLASSLKDLRHGLVLLRRDSGLSALIVLVLALGIGGNAAIFTLLKAAFLDPLPFRDAARLVSIRDRYTMLPGDSMGPTIPEYLDIRRRSRLIEEAAFLDHRDYQLTGADEPVRVFAARVTASLFPLLGVQAELGRTFTTEENRTGKTNVVIVSHSFWRSRMGADPNAVGKILRLNGDPCAVVGVLPAGFSFDYPTLGVPEPVEIYVPFVMDDYYTLRSGEFSNVRRVIALARLRPGETVPGATAELASIGESLTREYPNLYRGPKGESFGFSIGAQPLREAIVGNQRQLLTLLLAAVGLLLLIACANSAQLLLARGLQRSREVAIRSALGAGRLRLIRQFLLEGLVLAICGGAAGLLMSGWMARILIGLLPVRSPIFDRAALDVRVVAYTMAVSFLCTLLFALVPAVKGSLWTPGQALIARTAIGQGNRWRHAMMAVEAMLSVVLLSGAALLGQNLWKLVSTPAGFNLDHLWSMRLRLPFRHEQALAPMPSRAYRAYLEKISATPGVDSAAMVTGLPIRGAVQRGILLDGDSDDLATLRRQSAWYQIVSPEYFRTMGIPLIAGRTFRDDDIGGRPEVVIVNQEFVRRYSKGRDILGRTIGRGRPQTIVGVVGDVRMSAQTTAPQPQLYASYLQAYEPNITLVVRSPLPAAELLTRVKQAIHAAYPDQAVFNVMSMDEVLTNSVAEPRFHAFLIGMFAVLALAMAGSGMYSVISCIVGQRTGEIAIRIALGAGGVDIIRTVLGATATWLVGGLAAGVALGAASSNVVRKLSQSSVSASPSLYAAVVLFFLTVTLIAVCIPVRRASRMDPAIALRCE